VNPRTARSAGRDHRQILAPGHKVTEEHGRVIEQGGWTLYPPFHPSAGLRTPAVRTLLHEDFARLPV
jgi:uracil-DNA glycosylase